MTLQDAKELPRSCVEVLGLRRLVEREIRRETRGFVYYQTEALDIVRMRAGMQIGEEHDAQRPCTLGPTGNFELKMTNGVPWSR